MYTDQCVYLLIMSRLALSAAFIVCWSSGFVGAALTAQAASTTSVLTWRYVATSAVLVLAMTALRRQVPTRRELGEQVVIGLCAHVVFLGGVFAAAAAGADTSLVVLTCALQPLLVAGAGRLLWRDAVRLRQVAGLGVGLMAVVVTVGGPSAGVGAEMLLPLAGLLGLTTSALLERRWEPSLDALSSITVQVVTATVVFAAFAAVTGELALRPTPRVLGAIVWLVVLSGIGGYWTYTLCLRLLGGTSTSLLIYLTPPVTAVWAWVVLAETPTGPQVAGLVLGGAGVLLAWPQRTVRPGRGAARDPEAPVRAGHACDGRHGDARRRGAPSGP